MHRRSSKGDRAINVGEARAGRRFQQQCRQPSSSPEILSFHDETPRLALRRWDGSGKKDDDALRSRSSPVADVPTDNDNNNDDDDKDDEEMEIPYAQAFQNSQEQLRSTLSSQQREPLRPGDVVKYWHPAYCVGHAQGQRVAQVLQTRPGQSIPLELDNGDCLEGECRVRRVYEYRRGRLIQHHGIARPIATYRMTSKNRNENNSMDGLQRQVEHMRQVMTKARQEMELAMAMRLEDNDNSNSSNDGSRGSSKTSSATTTAPTPPPPAQPSRRRQQHQHKENSNNSNLSSSQDDDDDDLAVELAKLSQPPTRRRPAIPPLLQTPPKEQDANADNADNDNPHRWNTTASCATTTATFSLGKLQAQRRSNKNKITRNNSSKKHATSSLTQALTAAKHDSTNRLHNRFSLTIKSNSPLSSSSPSPSLRVKDSPLSPHGKELSKSRTMATSRTIFNTITATAGTAIAGSKDIAKRKKTDAATDNEESDDDFPPSVLKHRRWQRPQQQIQPNENSSTSSEYDSDDDFGASRCPLFSSERKIGLGFDRVQPKKKLRPMKSFFDGSRENTVGRPPRPPQDSIGRTDESLRQQQRDEFAMLKQTSNNNRSDATHKANIKTKVPSHRRTPTLLRPTVAEETHSSCHASSDETSNEDLPFVRKKREKPLLDNSSNIDSHRDLARQNHQRHVDRGYSSISSVDNSDPPQRSAVAGHRQLALSHRKPAALKVELLSSRRRR